jgi:hypothetical protein
MGNSKNHYERFMRFLSDTTIDDLLAATEGYQKSLESIKAVNEWAMKHACPESESESESSFEEFEDIFKESLIVDETLWFNLGWCIGWSAGAIEGMKKSLEQDTDRSNDCSLAGIIYSSIDAT